MRHLLIVAAYGHPSDVSIQQLAQDVEIAVQFEAEQRFLHQQPIERQPHSDALDSRLTHQILGLRSEKDSFPEWFPGLILHAIEQQGQ
jgi:hypothetical protein